MKDKTAQKIQWLQSRVWVPTVVGLALVVASAAAAASEPANGNRVPEVPDSLTVPPGNRLLLHGFGRGVQIYTWNGSTWGAAVPEATLVDAQGNFLAIHFGGPTWESTSGSKVVGAVLPAPVTVDPNAIPWLLLKAVSTEGPGNFADTSYIQRLNTAGGRAPSANGTFVGEVARVPYTADYFFYRQTND